MTLASPPEERWLCGSALLLSRRQPGHRAGAQQRAALPVPERASGDSLPTPCTAAGSREKNGSVEFNSPVVLFRDCSPLVG